MKALQFTLRGETAFFKDNTVNTIYLTYGNIHRVAILGILGSVLGYGGYNKQNNKLKGEKKKIAEYPEFYEKLQGLKISVVANSKYGTFPKKLQAFNNSVGYASKEEGGNLIVKQFWLEKPSWTIYILIDSKEAKKLSEKMLQKQFVYLPYLGSNDHFADISDIRLIDLKTMDKSKDGIIISSMVSLKKDSVEIIEFFDNETRAEIFKYVEYLPIRISNITNQYEEEKMMITNMPITNIISDVYEVGNEKIIFY